LKKTFTSEEAVSRLREAEINVIALEDGTSISV
jgi:hypothetical protein